MFGLLPATDEPPTVIINFRQLADISVDVLLDMQEWIRDIRGGVDGSRIIARIKELKLEKGTLGIAGFASINQAFYGQLQKAFPAAKFVDVSSIFTNARTIKSEEEIAMIDMANRIFDRAVERVCEVARPGLLGRKVLQEGINAIWAAGGDMHSSFNLHLAPFRSRIRCSCRFASIERYRREISERSRPTPNIIT